MIEKLRNFLQSEIDPAFLERARYILEKVETLKPKKVLDAGCGRGFYLKALTYFPFIREIHGIDINDHYLKIANQITSDDSRVFVKKQSIQKTSYQDNYFDLIICSEVIEHLKDDVGALRELKRVLKDKGYLIITVPNEEFPFLWDPLNWILMKFFKIHVNKNTWWLAGIWADHERLYSSNNLRKVVTQAGLEILETKYLIRFCWPLSHFMIYGLGKNIVESFNLQSVNRFNFNENKRLAKLISFIFHLPTHLESLFNCQSRTSTNIIVLLKKLDKRQKEIQHSNF
ncbi:MAG: class I SAM-dependent methyltransferase [Patescibacteria group bacterium]|nr:class I SAM-dependent methyltransferase [Patescibacteria group bacterium]